MKNKKTDLKFLANVNIEKPIVDFLLKNGYDVKWVADIDKKMTDTQVCDLANKEQRVILTNDKDFSEIVFYQKKIVYGIILFRIKGQNIHVKLTLLEKLLKNYSDKIKNHFVVVTKEKLKFILLEENYQ